MNVRRMLRLWMAALTAAVALGGGSASAPALTEQEQVGKRIFFEGRGAGDEIFAYFGRDNVRMPAVLLPCANCHGHDGTGRPEGGVVPPNITWQNLTKSYGHRHPNGREHGPFDEDAISGAVSGGTDPAGNKLDPLMPRYEMSQDDMAALVAFLKQLETTADPGLVGEAIRIGTLLPPDDAYGGLGQAVAGTIRAYFDEINASGGIFGRRLDLVVGEYSSDPEQSAANARKLLKDNGGVLAVLSDFTLGVEDKVFGVFEDAAVPQIDPFTLFAGSNEFASEYTFYLLSGLPDQGRALVEYTAQKLTPAPKHTAVVVPPGPLYADVARAVQDQAKRNGWDKPSVVYLKGDMGGISQAVTEMRQSGVDTIYYFGDTGILSRFTITASAQNWRPRLLLPGQTAGRGVFSLPKTFDGRIHMAYPNLPEDQSIEGRQEIVSLRKKHNLTSRHLASQVRAIAAAKVLVEALRRAGRSVSRVELVAALEGLGKFDTGQLPPVSFASNRRVGARGAHILTVDLGAGRFRPEDAWITID